MVWSAYSIVTDFERQKQVIRWLREWIQRAEARGVIDGYAFDHYSGRPDEPNHLSLRFDCSNEANLQVLRGELENEVSRIVPNFRPDSSPWNERKEVRSAYEFGSRCAFLFWELVDRGRFSQNYGFNFLSQTDDRISMNSIPLDFQFHFNHGVMNSLGVPKTPNEELIHLFHLINSTGSRTPDELCEWVRDHSTSVFRMLG